MSHHQLALIAGLCIFAGALGGATTGRERGDVIDRIVPTIWVMTLVLLGTGISALIAAVS